MGQSTTIRRLGVAAVCALCAWTSASALAHTESYKSKITIRERDGGVRYTGRVFSDLPACERNRRVKLFTADGTFVGAAETNGQGRWSFEFAGQRYYATAPRNVEGSGSHRHVCKYDRSPTTH